MDDPVQHFDNLNAYSFVDLIRGLVTNSGLGRQLIISTCDERLFKLMRQKLGSTDDCKTIFHVFESIGDSGPVVRELSDQYS